MKKIVLTLLGITLISHNQLKSMEFPLSISQAALSNNWKWVEAMLRLGDDPNNCKPDSKGAPIFGFIFKKNKKAIQKLIKLYNADINLSDPTLGTPLTYALTTQRFDIAKHLVILGADIDFPDAYGVIPKEKLREYDLLDQEYEKKDGASTATPRSNTPQKEPADKNGPINLFELHQKLLDLAI